VPGDRKVQTGDLITLDFGAKYCGYCADMTRTIALGEPGEKLRHLYSTVLEAQMTCQDALAPGKDCRAIDQMAHDIIDREGYGPYFGHGLGHAVGIDIHEEPRLSQTAVSTLEPGMVMTVEPGIYVPGMGGVRIENTCVITQTGSRSLVTTPREMIIL
jgi:Xaa-Pro aminopeptidase